MPKRVDLPPNLLGRPFAVNEARDAEVGEGRLRGRDLARPFHGIRAPVSDPREGNDRVALLRHCRAYAPLLRPGQFFSHLTAARLWNCPLPFEFTAGEPLHVSTLAPARAPRSRGIVGHQLPGDRAETTRRHGLPIVDASSTWCQLASMLPLDDLVAVGDALVLDPLVLDPLDLRPYLTLEQLRDRSANWHGHGCRAAQSALLLIRGGAESRPESLLRLLIARSALPEPEVNVDVTDTAGRVLGRGDLVYRRWRTVVEYDGDEHRTSSRQYDRDITRIENFAHAEWRVVRVRKRGLFGTPQATIARIERVLRAAGWRP